MARAMSRAKIRRKIACAFLIHQRWMGRYTLKGEQGLGDAADDTFGCVLYEMLGWYEERPELVMLEAYSAKWDFSQFLPVWLLPSPDMLADRCEPLVHRAVKLACHARCAELLLALCPAVFGEEGGPACHARSIN